MISKFYAVITPDIIGVFTNWKDVEPLVIGTKKAIHKSFSSYDGAKSFVFDHLTDDDILDFCLDRCPLYLNKKFVRKKQFIAAKEAQSK